MKIKYFVEIIFCGLIKVKREKQDYLFNFNIKSIKYSIRNRNNRNNNDYVSRKY